MLRSNPTTHTPEWAKQCSETVMKSWEDANERRQAHATAMREKWRTGKLTAEQSRENGRKATKYGEDNPMSLSIEYRGNIYHGWRELKEATGVSKHLYRKYYQQGVDPTARIGCNGPVAKGKESR